VVSTQVTIGQLVSNGLLPAGAIAAAGPAIAQRQLAGDTGQLIAIQRSDVEPEEELSSTSVLAWFATGMAVFFLMYTVSIGGRSILDERNKGTLSRMLTTPSSTVQVLGGKVTGIFLNGTTQVGLLIIATSLLFRMRWGDPVAVASLIVAVAAAATGWGILLASFAKEPAQVSSLGTAMMLLFGILGGTFGNFTQSGSALAFISKITPNAWALDGFYSLATGGTINDILGPLAALLIMAVVLFILAIFVFRRRWGAIA
jgi:ABC-2 type transport system permease protein